MLLSLRTYSSFSLRKSTNWDCTSIPLDLSSNSLKSSWCTSCDHNVNVICLSGRNYKFILLMDLALTFFENNWQKLSAVNFELDSITAREHKDCRLASACCRLLVLCDSRPLGDEGDSRYDVDDKLLFLLILGAWLGPPVSSPHWNLTLLANSKCPSLLFTLENKTFLR